MSHIFPADGEKMSTKQIQESHVLHPGVKPYFDRSTLLIGARGVGKTFVLRHRKHTKHKGAIYINLKSCLAHLEKDAGIGAGSPSIRDELAQQICSKSAALIIVETLKQALSSKQLGPLKRFPTDWLKPISPTSLSLPEGLNSQAIEELHNSLINIRLREWPRLSDRSLHLKETLADIHFKMDNQLTLFFDRGEDIYAPVVQLLLPLLDQSVLFLVVLAARPGIGQLIPERTAGSVIPSDHFDIVHLGSSPYRDDWLTFSKAAVGNYLKENHVQHAMHDLKEWPLLLGRDSIRQAISLMQISLDTQNEKTLESRANRLEMERNHDLTNITHQLYPENPDYRKTIEIIRKRFYKLSISDAFRPAVIELSDTEHQLSLLGEKTKLKSFLLKGIRCAALLFPPNYKWHPYELPELYEIPSLHVWKPENFTWIR